MKLLLLLLAFTQVPTLDVPQNAEVHTMIRVNINGLDLESLRSSAITIEPNTTYIPGTDWLNGNQPYLILFPRTAGSYNIEITTNTWSRDLESALIRAKAAGVDLRTPALDKAIQSNPPQRITGVLEVTGPDDPTPPPDPPTPVTDLAKVYLLGESSSWTPAQSNLILALRTTTPPLKYPLTILDPQNKSTILDQLPDPPPATPVLLFVDGSNHLIGDPIPLPASVAEYRSLTENK